MFKREHAVRWIAAVIAAIGLHALLWVFIPSTKSPSIQQQPMEIALMVGQIKAQAVAHRPEHTEMVAKHVKKQVFHKKKQQKDTKSLRHVRLSQHFTQPKKPPVIAVNHKENDAMLAKVGHKSQSSPKQAGQHVFHASHAMKNNNIAINQQVKGTNTVPKALQMRILMNVHYPKQARRHGWQGKVELQLEIQQKSIRKVTLKSSSGYPILDRAAYHGLLQLHHIALSNGVYRMPIVFRLQ
ncbi:MAG: TonB family protein [Zetaproteobacteria bacterium]|nr:TonB family protein [Zetaproteobacteria bacterium]